jgi:lysophospholipid acyltransferase
MRRLYFPGILVGPYIEYATYSSLVDGTLLDVTGGSEPHGPTIPYGRKRTAYRKLLLGLGFLGVYMGVAPKISFYTAVTDWFLEQGWPYRCVPPNRPVNGPGLS